MGIVIAGERSGVGKTTVTLALLAALKQQGLEVQSYKVGPDYIDPMFHQYITGRPCRNLDPVLTSEAYVQWCYAHHRAAADAAVVEGVMGLFDGVTPREDAAADNEPALHFASTAHIARLLNLPIVLVLDCSRLSGSVAAIAHGYCSLDPRLHFAGVILNRVGSDRHLELLHTALAPLGLPILGAFRRQDSLHIPDRHLGLVPTAELDQLDALLDRLAHLATTTIDWATLRPHLSAPPAMAPSLWTEATFVEATSGSEEQPKPVRLGVAQDSAFSFYYADNFDRLRQLGAELIPWSPLHDATLPDGLQGLYLGGGFPEVFAAALSSNQPMRQAIQSAIAAGMPTYAECGGLMYLSQSITDFDGHTVPMVGVLPTQAVMGQRLTLGYRRAIAHQPTTLIAQGQTTTGHEFHRSTLTTPPPQPIYQIEPWSSSSLQSPMAEGWCLQQLHASYLHLHWGYHSALAQRFLRHCQAFTHRRTLN